jgi:hypothetical protein
VHVALFQVDQPSQVQRREHRLPRRLGALEAMRHAAPARINGRYAHDFLRSCDGTIGWSAVLGWTVADMIHAGLYGTYANGEPACHAPLPAAVDDRGAPSIAMPFLTPERPVLPLSPLSGPRPITPPAPMSAPRPMTTPVPVSSPRPIRAPRPLR